MEIIAILEKPFTQEQKNEFLIEYNYNSDCEIQETEEELQAWAYTEEEKSEQREANFKSNFFEIKPINPVNEGEEPAFNGGWYRRKPKGYSSAVESMNTAFNIVGVLGKLPENTLIFYTAPDFTKEEECTEEWLIAHQFKNQEMNVQEFSLFYAGFMQAWNMQEHEKEAQINQEIDYTQFTVAQLKAIADEKGLIYSSNILKADLIALLENN